MKTYNQIKERLVNIKNVHKQIESVFVGVPSQDLLQDSSEPLKYPAMLCQPLQIDTILNDGSSGSIVFNFDIGFMDLPLADRSNEDEIRSDQLSIALDVVEMIRQPNFFGMDSGIFLDNNSNPSINFVTMKEIDNLTGAVISLRIKTELNNNRCEVPTN